MAKKDTLTASARIFFIFLGLCLATLTIMYVCPDGFPLRFSMGGEDVTQIALVVLSIIFGFLSMSFFKSGMNGMDTLEV